MILAESLINRDSHLVVVQHIIRSNIDPTDMKLIVGIQFLHLLETIAATKRQVINF